MIVDLSNRIVLNPLRAKAFSLMLNCVLAEYKKSIWIILFIHIKIQWLKKKGAAILLHPFSFKMISKKQ